jgi:hypothetical protein
VEKGFARTAFDRESVDPEAQINLVNSIIGLMVGQLIVGLSHANMRRRIYFRILWMAL